MRNIVPSFHWDPDDGLGSTARATLSPAGRAAYFDLLCHYWNLECKGLLPDEKCLRDLIGKNRISRGDLRKVVGCFKKKHGKLHNLKLQAIYRERVKYQKKASESGKKGAEKRWGPHIGPDGLPTDTLIGSVGSPSPSPSPSPEEKRGGEPSPLSDSGVRYRLKMAAEAAKIPNRAETLARYLEAWVAQKGVDEVVRILLLPPSRGQDVLAIHDAHFKGAKPSGVQAWLEKQKAEGSA